MTQIQFLLLRLLLAITLKLEIIDLSDSKLPFNGSKYFASLLRLFFNSVYIPQI